MKAGYLSQYFEGVAIKKLSRVEADNLHSNQHEFNGVKDLRLLLGEPSGKTAFASRFIYLTDDQEDMLIEDGTLTWYDARERGRLNRGINRQEFRLYFQTNTVLQLANEGDLLIIAKRSGLNLLAIVVEQESTMATQLLWLFGESELVYPEFSVRDELETERDRLNFVSKQILDNIGISIVEEVPSYLEGILQKFGTKFPSTREFSDYARSTLPDLNPVDGPDEVLLAWMEREEILFRTLEAFLVTKIIDSGFENSEHFLKEALSIHNRRKSRVGYAFENHLEHLFQAFNLRYSRQVRTELSNTADFIFPNKELYHKADFPSELLTMLGVKSTAKDRWRQVLTEADRISTKHLITLEPAISPNQTQLMQAANVKLVVPKQIQPTYAESQRHYLTTVIEFIGFIREKDYLASL